MSTYYVYILARASRGTLFIGVINDLVSRIVRDPPDSLEEVRQEFARKYNGGVLLLVYYEQFADAFAAMERERVLQRAERKEKNALIERTNPTWRDLADEIVAEAERDA